MLEVMGQCGSRPAEFATTMLASPAPRAMDALAASLSSSHLIVQPVTRCCWGQLRYYSRGQRGTSKVPLNTASFHGLNVKGYLPTRHRLFQTHTERTQ